MLRMLPMMAPLNICPANMSRNFVRENSGRSCYIKDNAEQRAIPCAVATAASRESV
jgi:hypothetical protein